MHSTHPALDSCQCLHDLRIAGILLRWQRSLGGRRHARYAYRDRWRRGHLIVIRIISPQLSIRLHQRLLAQWILDLHLWLASYTNA